MIESLECMFDEKIDGINEEKNEDENDEERDKFIFDLICNRYNAERERSKILDDKSSGIINFVGIIMSLQGGLGAILITDMSRESAWFIRLTDVFIVSIIFLTVSILCGLKAYYIRQWPIVPNAKYLVEEYVEKNKSIRFILRRTGRTMVDTIPECVENNNQKVKFIKIGFGFLVAGLMLNLLFIVELILIMID